MSRLRILRDDGASVPSILRRAPVSEATATPEMAERLRAVFAVDLTPAEAVDRIIAEVRGGGDAALRSLAERIDGVAPSELEVGEDEFADAHAQVPPRLVAAMERAARRIETFHRRQLRTSWLDFDGDSVLGQLVRPLRAVGLYAPGGRAVYPSTVLMQAVPAKVAGVGQVVMATPPRPDGRAAPSVLVAARLAGVDRVFKVGGAQAIAALAFGTETVPRVDKIVGPGNIFVALAKRRLYGEVGIDQVAGPTETVVVADDHADPATVAADLLAQAEHDPQASAVLLTPSLRLALAVAAEVEHQLDALPERIRTVAAAALDGQGGAIVTETLERALALADDYAPEHLCLLVADAWRHLGRVQRAGGVFVGEGSPETMGDYVAGPSHVMPTGGTARFTSAQSTDDFLRVTNLIALSDEDFRALADDAIALAEAEGLLAHAEAIKVRLRKGGQGGQQ